AHLQHVEPFPVSRAPRVRAPREPEPALFGLVPGPLAPPVSRTPMGPRWRKDVDHDTRDGDVRRTALLRRTVFLMLALLQRGPFASSLSDRVLPYHGNEPLEVAILTLSTILFAWVSLGFWTAVSGFILLCLGGDRHAITRSAARDVPIAADARTAVIMPIRN